MNYSVHDVAAVVIQRVGRIEAMKLQKLVYYSQAWHLAIEDAPLFDNDIEAWSNGPVIDDLYQAHRGRRWVSSWQGNPDAVTGRSRAVVDMVCGVYSPLSGDNLSELTHSETPWAGARQGLAPSARSRRCISTAAMKEFYRSRQLGSRDVADLIAGGLNGVMNESVTAEERRQVLSDIRQQFTGLLDVGQGLPAPVDSGGHIDCDHDGEVTARMVRERPVRGRV
jgi:uncharacterized phage-associated protein